MKKLKLLFRIIFGRTTVIVLSLLVQFAIFLSCARFLSGYMIYIYGGFTLLSAVILIYILNEETNASFKMAWIIPVLIIPVFGAIFYIFVNLQAGTKLIKKRLIAIDATMKPYMKQNEKDLQELCRNNPNEAGLMKYIHGAGNFPVYTNTNVEYFPLGEDKFAEMLVQLKKAKKFIFMEYFIVAKGHMWNAILDILKEKVQEGVEVRFMYDGMCSLMLLPYGYPKDLEKAGIRCRMFSPIRPVLSTYQNNRDHRKILVIDGHTAFTGGINLADEYINELERFGHWKDTAIMIQGDAVKSFTLMFLEMWNISHHKENLHEHYKKYINMRTDEAVMQVINNADYTHMQSGRTICQGGYVVPYGDGPFNGETIGKQVYIDILDRAKNYVHIMTPYLILDDEMMGSLMFSAKRGVDTVIIMPHIPDKIYAYLLARTYYKELIQNGVKIYEYTPGFVHAKVFTSDDTRAVVGTINLDFRSLYLHFECAAYIYKNPIINVIEEDFQKTLSNCQLITLEDCKKLVWWKKILGQVMRLIAPLM